MPKNAKSKNDKIAVVLFNLGGPDSLKAVKPFLYNLFSDPAIIQIPTPFRQILAKFISKKRDPIARKIYEEIGGKSPILGETEKQATALEKTLNKNGNYKVFIAMRYWHPFAEETIAEVKKYSPDKIILLPLYPQFSTTTTQSSFGNWQKQAKIAGLKTQTTSCCCYGENENFISAHVDNIKPVVLAAQKKGSESTPVRLLFSAHGLPQKIIDKGDPYADQVYKTVEKTISLLKSELDIKNIDYKTCFQSRVGPLKWLSPSLDDEIKQAANDNVGVIIVPISFVSEHSETLVELDIEYKKIASYLGITNYYRVPTLSTHEKFIGCLKDIVLEMSHTENKTEKQIVCNNVQCLELKKSV